MFKTIGKAITRAFEKSAYRKTYNELMKLSDKELNDIGLSRSQIRSVALEANWDNR